MISRVRVSERSRRMPKPPQLDLSGGMTAFLSQVPLTYSYQLSPGLALLSMPARSTPQAPSCGFAVAAGAARCAAGAAATDERAAASANVPAPARTIFLIMLGNPHPEG